MFERASSNPDAPLQPWQHMVSASSFFFHVYDKVTHVALYFLN